MNIEFKREDIKYVEIINRTITIKLNNLEINGISFTFTSNNQALLKVMEMVKQYDLIPVPDCHGRQYVLRDER